MNRRLIVIAAGAALVVAACGGGGTPAPSGGGSGDLEGKIVNVGGAFVDAEATTSRSDQAVRGRDRRRRPLQRRQVVRAAAQRPGPGRQPAGRRADPTAGRDEELRATGQPLPAARRHPRLRSTTNYGPGWKELGTAADGKVYGVFHRVNVKGNVFYPKAAFDDARATRCPRPGTSSRPSGQDQADGGPPGASASRRCGTGWPATDWVEAIMLRTAATDTYDKWASHALPFTTRRQERGEHMLDI